MTKRLNAEKPRWPDLLGGGGVRPDKKYFLRMLLFANFVFFPLISQRLTNTIDGLWTTTEYLAGWWELSNGRWFWPVLSFLRFSIQLNPLNAEICLVCIACGVTLIRQLFLSRDSGYVAGMCYISSTVIGCYLSFHFISPEYGVSFLLAVLAACSVITADGWRGPLKAALFLAMSLGLYQTNLACFCLILLAYFLAMLFRNEEKQKIRMYMVRSLCSAALGAVIYWLVLQLILTLTGVRMADYQGGSSISLQKMLKNLPQSIGKCYRLFAQYFFGQTVKHHVLQNVWPLYAVIFLAVAVAFLRRVTVLARRKDAELLFYAIAALVVMPLASVVFMLAATEATFYIPMAGSLALFFPLCFWLLDGTREMVAVENAPDRKNRWSRWESTVLFLMAMWILYGSVFMSEIDQQAMYEGRQATTQIADRIAERLVDYGYYDTPEQMPVMFVGYPSANGMFRTHTLYKAANPYAQVGLFKKESGMTMRYSWSAVFRDYVPLNLTYCSDEQYEQLIESEEISQMPDFPASGSIKEVDGVLVVKVSDDYLLDDGNAKED